MAEPLAVKLVGDGLLIVDIVKALVPVLATAVGGILTFFGVRYGQRQAATQAREQLQRAHDLEVERMRQKVRIELAVPVLNRVRELSEAVLKSLAEQGKVDRMVIDQCLSIAKDVKLFFSPAAFESFSKFDETIYKAVQGGLPLSDYLARRDTALRVLWQDIGGPEKESRQGMPDGSGGG